MCPINYGDDSCGAGAAAKLLNGKNQGGRRGNVAEENHARTRSYPGPELLHERLPRGRHPVHPRHRPCQPGERVGVERDGGDAALLQRHREPDDRRAAGASHPDAEDGGVAVRDDRRT